MTINANIPLMGRSPNPMGAFQDALTTLQMQDTLQQNRLMSPLRHNLMKLQMQGQELQNQQAQYQLDHGLVPGAKTAQFGATSRFKDASGRVFYGTLVNNPYGGTSTSNLVAADGSGAQPQGQLIPIGQNGLTPNEQVDLAGSKTAATENAKDNSTSGLLSIEQMKLDNAKKQREATQAIADKLNSAESQLLEVGNAISTIDDLLTDDKFSNAFGKWNNGVPEHVRRQSTLDSQAQINQIVGLISLESRQKLKGQGTISDAESKMLSNAATILSQPLISDDLAKRELGVVRNILTKAFERAQKRVGSPAPQSQPSQYKEGQTATNPQTGEKLTYKNGKWVPSNG